MRRITLILITILISHNVQAQKAQQLFDHANELFEQRQYDSAFYLFQKIYAKKKSGRSLRSKAYYNSGVIYLQKKDTIRAKKIFENLLLFHFDDMDSKEFGAGFDVKPYSLYRNNTCIILAEIAIVEKSFEKALGYLFFTENVYVSNAVYMAEIYAKCYEGLGDTNKALQYLMPEVLKKVSGENDSLIERAKSLIRARYSVQEIKKEIDSALKKITPSMRINRFYYTTLFGTQVNLEPTFYSYSDPVSKMYLIDQIIYTILNSKFIKELLSGK